MAAISNTHTTDLSKRNRETLDDMISIITADETPLLTLIGSETVEGIKPEWNLDALANPDTANAFAQGDQYSYNAITPTTRVGNYTQILRKSFIVAKTQEAVKKAGAKSDFNREKLKKGQEIRIDLEVIAASNQASVAPSGATAGKLGGLRAWVASNDDMGATGASGGYNTGTGLVTAATNGTQRAFTKALMDNNIQAVYQAGGNPTTLMVSPYNKRVFSTFMSDANVVANRGKVEGKEQARIYAAADEYLSDFGLITVMPNRQWARAGAAAARNAFLLEPGKLAMGVLRPIAEDTDVVPNADAKAGVLITEQTLIVKNEAALGVIADLFGLTAST
ncbi:DUF5309 domain-containing protein [Microvirga lotononidis]|uniref:Phage capsid family protein n=1 Tax=Microvirga lotononidis TaxID=864069 RepID=I4YP54_9HYPH|nr:DUF5309 domain-containing protein [Microvirga lotononidis]EIM25746.1 hypothetical protein MicloDRAFT_00064730 [Microvirga lotononidis]WQO25675.1 DUF5309 domain-containing protein [Microvirga lotononidis]